MSGMGRRFDPAEIRPDAGPGPSDAELAEAMLAARELEALGARDAVGPTAGFEDRVMAAIATEPAPRVLVRAGRNVRYGLLGGFAIAVRDAWRVATGGGRPVVIRAQAMAFVLLVVLATGSLSVFAAVGAASLLSPGPTATPRVPTRTASPVPASPSALPSPSPTASPSSSPMVEPSRAGEPGTIANPTGTDGATEAPRTARTPRPTRTPKATETPEPTETDEAEPTEDDGGGGGGGGDDSSGPGGGD
jgi:hypothetical protein